MERRGRSLAGRPHFARVMVEKGYVSSIQQAFDEYLDESAKGYVDREEPQLPFGIERIRAAGGISSIAHPIRVGYRDPASSCGRWCAEMRDAGLSALEVYHSDHRPADVEQYLGLTREFGSGSNRRIGFPRRREARRSAWQRRRAISTSRFRCWSGFGRSGHECKRGRESAGCQIRLGTAREHSRAPLFSPAPARTRRT